MIHGNVITPTVPPLGLAIVCILLDVLRAQWEKDYGLQDACIDAIHFLDGSFVYKNMDRVGGIISYLRKIHHYALIERLGRNHRTFAEEYEQRLFQAEFNDLYSSLFIISGSPATGFSITTQVRGEDTTR